MFKNLCKPFELEILLLGICLYKENFNVGKYSYQNVLIMLFKMVKNSNNLNA